MPDYIYVGDAGRVYPTLPPPANGPEVGSTYRLPGDPGDGRWEPARSKKPDTPPPAPPIPDPAPAGDTKE